MKLQMRDDGRIAIEIENGDFFITRKDSNRVWINYEGKEYAVIDDYSVVCLDDLYHEINITESEFGQKILQIKRDETTKRMEEILSNFRKSLDKK